MDLVSRGRCIESAECRSDSTGPIELVDALYLHANRTESNAPNLPFPSPHRTARDSEPTLRILSAAGGSFQLAASTALCSLALQRHRLAV